MTATLRLVYHTAKVRLGFLIMACALAGIAVSPGHQLSAWQIAILGIADTGRIVGGRRPSTSSTSAISTSVCGAPHTRPFVTGRFKADATWNGGIIAATLLAVLAAAWATNGLAAMYVFLGAFTYGVVYTVWLKRRTWLNIVIGGLAGSFAVLAGSAAAGATLSPAPLLLAIVLFFWTPPHFWALAYACRDDYRAAGVPMLPVVAGDRLVTRTILGARIAPRSGCPCCRFWYGMGWIYLLAALAGGSFFILACIRLMLAPGISAAWRAFAASIVQLGLLLTAAIADRLILG